MPVLSADYKQSLVEVKKNSLYNPRSNHELLLAPPTFNSSKRTGDRAFQLAAPSGEQPTKKTDLHERTI